MITCPVCRSLLDEMGHPQVKCPYCGTVIDTPPQQGGAPPPGYQYAPPPPGYIPAGPDHMPAAYVTPPGMQGIQTIQHAGLLKRFLALLIDSILLAIVTLPLTFILIRKSLMQDSTGFSMAAEFERDMIIVSIITTAITILYFIFMEGKRQQTVGKLALDIIVVREDMHPITMDESIKRNLLRLLYSIPMIGSVFYLIDGILVYKDYQRIGDKVAHTYVVDKGFYDSFHAASMRYQQFPGAPPPFPPPPPSPPPFQRPDEY